MKFLIFALFGLLTVAHCEDVSIEALNTINDAINATLENVREQMPCGFPNYGVPPLAPLLIENLEIDLDSEGTLE